MNEELPKRKSEKRPVTLRSMSERIYKREDNHVYRLSMIVDVLQMYFEEVDKALVNGEKVKLHNIGSLSPQVHTPITYNVDKMNAENGNKPYTRIQFTRSDRNKQKMNAMFLRNIKHGFAGLGENCQCNQLQKNILIDKGILNTEIREEGDSTCLEE